MSVCLSTYGSFLVPDYFSSSSSLPCTCRSLRRAAPRCSDCSVAHLSSLRHDKCRSQLWGHTAREQWCVQIHCRSRPHTCPLSGCSTPLVDMLSAQGVEWWNCCLHTYRKEFRRLQRYISRNEMIKYSQRIWWNAVNSTIVLASLYSVQMYVVRIVLLSNYHVSSTIGQTSLQIVHVCSLAVRKA